MIRLAPSRPLVLFLGLLLLPLVASAQDDIEPPTVTDTYALENARVVQAPGQVLDRATIVIRDGVIEAVGPDAPVPYDARRIAADSLTVYAGFIDGLSHAGVEMPEADGEESGDEEVDPGDPPLDRSGIQPDRSVRPFLSPEESSLQKLRKAGFTAGHVAPKGRMLPGAGAYVLYGGETANDMMLEATPTRFAQIRGAEGYVYPATEMAVIATMRQLFREAERRQGLQQQYQQSKTGPRPPQDPTHQALMPVLNGSTPMAVYADDALTIHRVLNLQGELGFPLVLAGLGESFRTLDPLRAADAALFLTLALPEAPETPTDADTTVADTTTTPGRYYDPDHRTADYSEVDAEETNLRLRHAVERDRYRRTAATLEEAGLSFGFTTREATPGDVRSHLRTMIEHGLSPDAALAALTTRPASLLGLDDRLGTVEPGKVANLVVTDGNYFEEDTKVQHVFVDGRLYDYATEAEEGEITGDVSAVVGTWSYTLKTPRGEVGGTLTITGDQSGLDGTLENPQGEARSLEAISFDGTTLSFTVDSERGSTSVSVTVEGDTFEGSVSIQSQTLPITGERTSPPDGR